MGFRQILMAAATQGGGAAAVVPVTTAWLPAASGASNALAGDSPAPGSLPTWVNPSFITADDGLNATRAAKATTNSDTLRALFDFSSAVPSGATILGVELSTKKVGSGWNDLLIQLVTANTPSIADRVGTNKATGTAWPATEAEVFYGGAADLWGATLTAAIVRATFGVDIRSNKTSGAGGVGFVQMRVTYAV